MYHDGVIKWIAFFVKGMHWYAVTLDSPHKWPIMWNFDVSFFGSLKKLLKKQLSCKGFQMPWCSCDITVMETYHPKSQIYIIMITWILDIAVSSITKHYTHDYMTVTWNRGQAFNTKIHPILSPTDTSPVNGDSLHKWPVTRKKFPYDDVITILNHHRNAFGVGSILG